MQKTRTGPDLAAPVESQLDWNEALSLVRACLHRHLSETERQEIDDLAQEASLRLLRAVRRGSVGHVEGLASDIARKTAADFVRRRVRWRSLMQRTRAEAQIEGERVEAPVPAGDPVERVRFLVLEFFRESSPLCHDLARTFLDGAESWVEVGERKGISHAAVRRRWSRCLAALRARVRDDGDLLSELRESLGR